MHNQHISKAEFNAKTQEYLHQVEVSGETLIVTDHGRPTLEVRPFRSGSRSPLEVLRGSVLSYQSPLEPVSAEDWEVLR